MPGVTTDILESFGLQAPPVAQESLVFATVVAASPDVALLRVRSDPPYEGVIPVTEFYPGRPWAVGERLLLEQVGEPPLPLLTATRPELVSLLFDGYSPEIRSGAVRVMGIARRPGVRTKVAVASTEPHIDPVASCVGRAANRVRAVSEMLGGERVDVIAWSPDRTTYLRNALAPAAVTKVVIAGHQATAIAPPHQMSAAVGGGGLNAALAGQLVGLKVVVAVEGSEEAEACIARGETS